MKTAILFLAGTLLLLSGCAVSRGTGDLGLVVERASGAVILVETTGNTRLAGIDGLGDLSHASIVYSRDQRFGYVFGRDGGLTKIDLLQHRIAARVVQAGNSIGGAISQDGRLVAVSNYEPGGVRVFDAGTLELIADIPSTPTDQGKGSKVVGLVDAPGQRFVFSLFDTNEIWILDMQNPEQPRIHKFENVGKQPFDGLITPEGRFYIAGLFGEDGLALVDLWNPDEGARRILPHYGRGEQSLPVYKMPHLEGWAVAGDLAFMPAVGHHEVLVANTRDWTEVKQIPMQGQPVFVMAQPDGRRVWVNFAHPKNNVIQIIDTQTLEIAATLAPGKAIMHMEFTPRGEAVWVSARDDDRLVIYDTASLEPLATLPARHPSGIFFTSRAHRIGL